MSSVIAKPVSVEPFTQHRELLPLIAAWFVSEWPGWYDPGVAGNAAQVVAAFAASDVALPIGFIIFDHGQPVGAGTLKAASIPSHARLGPWAAAGYLLPSQRGRGLGAALVRGLLARAHQLGYGHIYCGTSTADGLLRRAGWSTLEVTVHAAKPLTIYQRDAQALA